MNKKLIALAVGSALGVAPMAASAAKVTVYGMVQFELANVDGGTGADGIAVVDNQRGRFGIKASEKLGNGMTAMAKVEYDLGNSKDGDFREVGFGDTPSIREANVGLKGGFGTVEIGTIKSAYKYFGGVKYDPFVATTLEARGNGGMSSGTFSHNAFLNNSIGYKSPKMNGLSAWLTFSPDEQADAAGNSRGADGDYTLGIKYGSGPFEVGVAASSDDSADRDAAKIFGMYKFGNHKFLGQYEQIDAAGTDTDVWFLGYHLKSGNNTFVAQLGNTDPDGASNDTDYYTIGLIHKMSKKTRVFTGYRNTDPDGSTETDVFSVGLRMDF